MFTGPEASEKQVRVKSYVRQNEVAEDEVLKERKRGCETEVARNDKATHDISISSKRQEMFLIVCCQTDTRSYQREHDLYVNMILSFFFNFLDASICLDIKKKRNRIISSVVV